MISVSTGYSTEYLTDAVGTGREDYYTGAVTEGEPPGTWHGAGAAALGLDGEVDAEVMRAVYGKFTDPTDPRFADESTRPLAGRLGRAPKQFRTPDEVVAARVEAYSRTGAGAPAPEQVQAWRVEAERSTPQAVMFYDMTFSVPKSITVLWAAYSRAATDASAAGDTATAAAMAGRADAVEAAIASANKVMLDHVEAQTLSRIGRHGGAGNASRAGGPSTGRWVNTGGLSVASFPQHTSRERDPQLHTHNAILNRVQCPDGQWRAIDGKSLYGAKASASAVAGLELRERLTRELGVGWVLREDGNDYEIAGITTQEMDLLSARGQTLTAAAEDLIKQFEAHHGRAATAYEQRCLRQDATLSTRPAKSHQGETQEEMLDRADAVMRGQFAGGLTPIAYRNTGTIPTQADGSTADASTGAGMGAATVGWSPQAVITRAVEECHGEGGRSTFSRAELSRRIALALPGTVGLERDGDAARLIEQLTDQALASPLVVQTAGREIGQVPGEHRLADGRAATISPDAIRYAARGHVAAEYALLRAAGVRGRTHVERAAIAAWLDDPANVGAELAPAQREAVAGLASSDAGLAVLIGPAGTGKSYTVGRLAEAWSDLTGGRVVGVATAQVAADVLRDDGVGDTANTTAFLAAQDRIIQGRALPADAPWRLGERDILVVDEASMVDTGTLTRLQATAGAAGARVVLLGDPRQLGAVGAGGMMRTLAHTAEGGTHAGTADASTDACAAGAGGGGERLAAEVYTLGEVRRFSAGWEREASLRLRDGHQDVVTQYDRRGRVVEAGRERDAVTTVAAAAAADRLAGRDTVVVTASNRLAAEVAAGIRRHLVAAGEVEEAGVILGRDGCTAGVGDLVQARRIDRGLGLTNRETYRVTAVTDDGALQVISTRTGHTRLMPAGYVAADAALGYAGTVHATQGATVDAGHVLLTPGLSAAAAYVGLTRGRETNTAWAVTDPGIPNTPTATGRGLLAAAIGTSDHGDLSARDVTDNDQAWRTSTDTLMALTEDHTRIACRARLDGDLDQLVADGHLSERLRARFGADPGSEHLSRQLRALEQAGHDPAAVLHVALTSKPLESAVSVAQVVSDRLDRTHRLPVPDPKTTTPERISASDADYLGQLDTLTETRRHTLGARLAEQPTDWTDTVLGSVPDAHTDPVQRAAWIERAGTIAGHREATGWDSPTQALGRCPGIHTPEKRADWHRAYAAAGMPEDRRPDAELPDGRLLARAAAADRTRAGAPDFVDPAMRARHLAADHATRDAALARSLGDHQAADLLDADAAAHTDAAHRLTQIADERAAYLALHAETLTAGDSARAELTRRGITPGHETDRTTATAYVTPQPARQEHDQQQHDQQQHDQQDGRDTADLAGPVTDARIVNQFVDQVDELAAELIDEYEAHQAAQLAEDEHRVITENDILDPARDRSNDPTPARPTEPVDAQAGTEAGREKQPGQGERPAQTLSAEASAAAVAVAARRAETIAEQAADTASQNASEPDDWHHTSDHTDGHDIDERHDAGNRGDSVDSDSRRHDSVDADEAWSATDDGSGR